MTDTIHRDIFNDVMEAYKKIAVKNPAAPTAYKLRMAKQYVRLVAMADSVSLMRMVRGESI
jgi:hypothetical protein